MDLFFVFHRQLVDLYWRYSSDRETKGGNVFFKLAEATHQEAKWPELLFGRVSSLFS